MGRYYGEQQACYPTTPPRPDDKRYPAPEDTGQAQRDGFTVVKRVPFGATPGTNWMKPSEAEDYERMQREYPSGNVYGDTPYSDY